MPVRIPKRYFFYSFLFPNQVLRGQPRTTTTSAFLILFLNIYKPSSPLSTPSPNPPFPSSSFFLSLPFEERIRRFIIIIIYLCAFGELNKYGRLIFTRIFNFFIYLFITLRISFYWGKCMPK